MQEYVIKGYKVTESYDRDVHTVAYASSRHVADLIKESNNSAYRHVSPHEQTIRVFDSIEEYDQNLVDRAKGAALAKLTPAERQLLGLDQ